MRSSTPTLILALMTLLTPLVASAGDTVITLSPGDRFVVKDAAGVERLILDGTTGSLGPLLRVDNSAGSHNDPALVLIGRADGATDRHPLALVRGDSPASRDVTWLWKAGGGAITNLNLKIDGDTHVGYDGNTDKIQIITDPGFFDPDKIAAGLPTMLQLGADVEFATIMRANHVGCQGCSPARPEPKAFLVLDHGKDWAFEMHWDGRMRWGDAGPTPSPTSDGDQGESSFDTELYRVENGADETMEFELDGDGDGQGTRRVAVAHPHPQGTGAATAGGVTVWGNSGVAAVDSGDEICASVPGGSGLGCHLTLDPTDGSEHPCNAPHPASESTTSGLFQALCF